MAVDDYRDVIRKLDLSTPFRPPGLKLDLSTLNPPLRPDLSALVQSVPSDLTKMFQQIQQTLPPPPFWPRSYDVQQARNLLLRYGSTMPEEDRKFYIEILEREIQKRPVPACNALPPSERSSLPTAC